MLLTIIRFSIRVRYAPSPTGYMHLGNLRIALYNYLFAKANDGEFVLRIEDTDRLRYVETSFHNICNILEWSNLIPDEGPNYKGSFGPYVQSMRLGIYHKYIDKLLSMDKAYMCFCSDERLQMLKNKSQGSQNYDGKCKNLSPLLVEQHLKERINYCVRFKLSSIVSSYHDLIYGKINQNVYEKEGDPIILKSDKFPTYHFANVVDDHLMKITHVIRGCEWMSSTIKHIMLYEAFGWEVPTFAHLPLIFNRDGSKLSKRNSDLQISELVQNGYYPEALLNFITLGSGGFDTSECLQGDVHKNLRLKSLTSMARDFNLGKIRTLPLKVDFGLLDELNKRALHERINHMIIGSDGKETTDEDTLVQQLREYLEKKYGNDLTSKFTTNQLYKVIKWAGCRVNSLKELTADPQYEFLWKHHEISEGNAIPSARVEICKRFLERLTSQNLPSFNVNQVAEEVLAGSKLSCAEMFGDLRTLLTGRKKGPSIKELINLLGGAEATRRIDLYMKFLSNSIITTKCKI